MNEHFNHPSEDQQLAMKSRQIEHAMNEKMFDREYLAMVKLAQMYQQQLAEADGEAAYMHALSEFEENLGDLDVLQTRVRLSGNLRAMPDAPDDELEDLLNEGEDGGEEGDDEYGHYVHLMNAEGFRVTSCFQEAGQIGYVVTDDFQNMYRMLPQDIISMIAEEGGGTEALFSEVAALYPEAMRQYEALQDAEDSMQLIEALDELEIVLRKNELHDSIDVVAQKLGRIATAKADLDRAPQRVTFKHEYKVKDTRQEFRTKYLGDEAEITAGIKKIHVGYRELDDEHYLMNTSLDLLVNLPGKQQDSAIIRVPSESFVAAESTRIANMDLLLGDETSEEDYHEAYIEPEPVLERAVEDTEQDIEEALREALAENVRNLMRSQNVLNGAFRKFNECAKQRFETQEEMQEYVERHLSAAGNSLATFESYVCDPGHKLPLTYTGEGVVTKTSQEPSIGRISMLYADCHLDPYHTEEGFKLNVIIRCIYPAETAVTEDNIYTPAENSILRIPLAYKQEHVSEGALIVIDGEHPILAPEIEMLAAYNRRQAVIAEAKELFGELDNEVVDDIETIVDAFQFAEMDLTGKGIARLDADLSHIQLFSSKHPSYNHKLAELLATCLTSYDRGTKTALSMYMYEPNSGEYSASWDNAILVDIYESPDEKGDSEITFLVQADGREHLVPFTSITSFSLLP